MFDHTVIFASGLDKYQGGPNYRVITKYVDRHGHHCGDVRSAYLWADQVPFNLNYLDTRLPHGREHIRPIMGSITKWVWGR